MNVTLLFGDVIEQLRTLPDESVQVCVTSPPYWGLRSYLPDDHPLKALEIGQEPSVQEFLDKLVLVFREVRRVLKKDGTLWVNMGDAYASGGRGGNPNGDTSTLEGGRASQEASMVKRQRSFRRDRAEAGEIKHKQPGPQFKDKDLIGQPWRLAFALQADGWYLRQDIIWHKPNPMPESMRDRCTKAHEYIFLLAKSERYYYNAESLKEPASPDTHARYARAQSGYAPPGQDKHEGLLAPRENANRTPSGWNTAATGRRHDEKVGRYANSPKYEGAGEEHRSKAGLATAAERFKPSLRKLLAEDSRDAKANASFDQAMRDMPETRNKRSVWTITTEPYRGAHFATFPTEIPRNAIKAGSRPGDTVLDPFMGSGTTAQVALELHRHAVGIDLDERNRALIEGRLRGQQIGMPLDAPVQEAA